jgi:periplasmic glucans biosynthesis protein
MLKGLFDGRLLKLLLVFGSLPGGRALAADDGSKFSFLTVRELARSLAARPYHPEQNDDLPDALKKLNYDQYQAIKFRPERSLWKEERVRFIAQFFPRGYLYLFPVTIHVIADGQVSDLAFSPEQFDFGTNRIPPNLPPRLQFAGFRLLYPLNSPQKMDEVAEFLGASYFRVLGAGQRYGSSVRGLAIDTGEPTGEEFPRFTEFWLEKPPSLAGGVRIYALMDSPSLAGAYRFVIEPGDTTSVEVESSLFFRKSPKKIGIAPLGSLFLVGQNRTHYIPDYRPQVHDADGLLVEAGAGDWRWRPLVNPANTHRISQWPAAEAKKFGLMQREREFRDYDDLESRFELRPSYWVEPGERWGPGAVELVEIPSPNEYNDNVVAYWSPRNLPAAGQELHLTYRVSASLSGPAEGPVLRVRSTRLRPETDGRPPRFVIDFAGSTPSSADLSAAGAAHVEVSQGRVQNLVVQTNGAIGGWQAFFDLDGVGDKGADLRLRLQSGNDPASETWVYDYNKSN